MRHYYIPILLAQPPSLPPSLCSAVTLGVWWAPPLFRPSVPSLRPQLPHTFPFQRLTRFLNISHCPCPSGAFPYVPYCSFHTPLRVPRLCFSLAEPSSSTTILQNQCSPTIPSETAVPQPAARLRISQAHPSVSRSARRYLAPTPNLPFPAGYSLHNRFNSTPFRTRQNVLLPQNTSELHNHIYVISDDPFGPHIEVFIPTTPTSLCAVYNPYLHIRNPFPSFDQVFRSTLLRNSISKKKTCVAYKTENEQFRYKSSASSSQDHDRLDDTIADYIEEEHENVEPKAYPQKIKKLLAMVSISAPSIKGKLSSSHRLVKSWSKNRTPSPLDPTTQQMAAAFAVHLLNYQRLRAGNAIIVEFASLLRPSEIFSLT